jgi:chemotaxis-related protein WspB
LTIRTARAMKALVFHIGADRYALPLAVVNQVLPAASLKQLPLAPPYVAGLLDLHGEPVPVIDLSRLAGHEAPQVWFDTRIVLVDFDAGAGAMRALGLLAEHVSGIITIDPASLAEPGVRAAPFLGQVASTPEGMVQLVTLQQLLSDEVRALLFQAPIDPAPPA